MTLRTSYEFTLPRGYVDPEGRLHQTGVMRLATARDELEPLRDPTVSGPDDPRLTILVLTRVVTQLGTLERVHSGHIEGLFAVDLAFLQDFYGVINFGDQDEYDALMRAQEQSNLLGAPGASRAAEESAQASPADEDTPADEAPPTPTVRGRVEEMPRKAQ